MYGTIIVGLLYPISAGNKTNAKWMHAKFEMGQTPSNLQELFRMTWSVQAETLLWIGRTR